MMSLDSGGVKPSLKMKPSLYSRCHRVLSGRITQVSKGNIYSQDANGSSQPHWSHTTGNPRADRKLCSLTHSQFSSGSQ